MISIKPEVTPEKVISLLNQHFTCPIVGLAPLAGGSVAQTIAFQSGNEDYVIRFTTEKMDASYQKEYFIYKNFASTEIPISPVIAFGHYENLYYSISRKIPGIGLDSLPEARLIKVLPHLIRTLFAIHRTDVSAWQNYGWIDDNGTGLFPSWKEFITRVYAEERSDGFYGKWHYMFNETFLDREFFEKVYRHMLKLLQFCPEKRYLVHGGYGFNNILVNDDEVTAVLDWFDAMYGDFVYDIAWIDLWPRGIDYSGLLYKYYAEHGEIIPDFTARVTCYKCYIGLDAMRFFAKTDNESAYDSICHILQDLIDR
ncbi:MAG: aminoglycoside phosphotransferase family protein [Candidatus Cloacimonetes bacterium]|nr:aminoglycoside phosphotransferase family protein [Candidatus Cloacimonadota bacterium]